MASLTSAAEDSQGMDDMMRILVGKLLTALSCVGGLNAPPYMTATDNHIGYMEKDPVRYRDSLEAFEEVLKTAKSQDVSTGHKP